MKQKSIGDSIETCEGHDLPGSTGFEEEEIRVARPIRGGRSGKRNSGVRAGEFRKGGKIYKTQKEKRGGEKIVHGGSRIPWSDSKHLKR